MQIENEKVVSIHYSLRNNQGELLDQSQDSRPLVYLHGKNNIIPGLEKALEGKLTGDKMSVSVPPEEAYGVRNEEMVMPVPRESFAGIEDLQPGMQFQMNSQSGPVIITVIEVGEDDVIVDANHPLAGETLNFEVEIMDVREATQEELQHGHVHGDSGHHH